MVGGFTAYTRLAFFPDELPAKPTYEAANKEEITNKVMDYFGGWLFDHAKNLMDPTKKDAETFVRKC